MLEHEQPEALSIPPAAEKRVTSEEFARAVAAIEARKADQAKSLAGTLPIGQGINELGLDASAEEVWAEVEAQRARAAAQRVTPPQPVFQPQTVVPNVSTRQKPRRYRGWIALGVFFFLFGISRHAFFPSFSTPPTHSASAPAATPVIRTLQEVPNDHEVYCDTATLRQILQSVDSKKILVREDEVDNGWRLIKYGGQVYLRGYIVPTSADAIKNAGIHLYNDDNAGELEGIQQGWLTVRADAAHLHLDDVSGNSDWTELKTTHVHLDEHAFEDWRE